LEGYLAPATLSKKIAEIWAQVLELERVSIYDNFRLGGDSISSIQIIAKNPASWFTGYTQAAV